MTDLSGFDLAAYNNPASNAAQVHGELLLFFCSDLEMKFVPELNPKSLKIVPINGLHWTLGYVLFYIFVLQIRDNLGSGKYPSEKDDRGVLSERERKRERYI